jgi:hypothetical protein
MAWTPATFPTVHGGLDCRGIVRQVSDAFLLTMAEISASLIGLFLVGVFFYVETGLRRLTEGREVFESYLRAGIRITLIVFAIPLVLSLTLVALEPVWARVLFALLSLMLLAANYDSAARIWAVWRVTRSTALLLNEVMTSVLALALIVIPWVLGGLYPTREDLTWSILLSFGAGFLSIIATVMSAFDIARTKS